jgi:hypothetical protein
MNTAKNSLATLFYLILLIPLVSITISSCDNENGEDTEGLNRLLISGGNHQSERIGAVLPEPMTVRVTSITGDPVSNLPVFFTTDDAGAGINPPTVNTDNDGYASTYFRLGSNPGSQSVGVRAGNDSTTFNHTAVALGCTEENPEAACQWPAGHIFITTTSSSMIGATGSVLIDFNPETGYSEKVLETPLVLHDIDFSSRGEMFVITDNKVYKVLPDTKVLSEYTNLPVLTGSEIEFNMGGVLLMAGNTNIYSIGCSGADPVEVAEYYTVNYENLGTDPVSRNFYIATGSGPLYNIFYNEWDGRGSVTSSVRYEVETGIGSPRGMCVDMEGFLYITIDSNGNSRSVARFRPGVANEPKWFDFFSYFEGNNQLSGRWGDITIHGDHLYLIDTRMNRLVVLDATGTTDSEKYFAEYPDEVYSLEGSDSERYGIAAVPEWNVCLEPY